MWAVILFIHIVMSDVKGSTKNKFELDRSDQDSHTSFISSGNIPDLNDLLQIWVKGCTLFLEDIKDFNKGILISYSWLYLTLCSIY